MTVVINEPGAGETWTAAGCDVRVLADGRLDPADILGVMSHGTEPYRPDVADQH
ncbi:MAG: hypothetical protein ACRDVG_13030 [Jatrophihabitantaceae bacterium]